MSKKPAKKNPKKVSKQSAAYKRKLKAVQARDIKLSAAGRDISGDWPKAGNRQRYEACRNDLRLFCESYLPAWFLMEWSDDHLAAIHSIEQAVLRGGLFALAMPRGSGKTTLCLAAALWSLLYGHRRFVCIIAATEPAALGLLEKIKSTLTTNELLAQDFRGVCHAVRKLENDGRRARGQLFGDKQTKIGWGSKGMTLPIIPASAFEPWETLVGGSTVTVRGITGALRGQSHVLGDGTIIRPDFVLIDDPQDRESANSASQCDERVAILNGDVLGLAGPGKKISAVMPCTVIKKGDMADQMLDRKLHPQWQGQRMKMLYEFPDRMDLWEQYAEIRGDSFRGGGDGSLATAFYTEHKLEMDAGARIAWTSRYDADEITALQHAMNLLFRNKAAFLAEYQNEPEPPEGERNMLQPAQVIAKAIRLGRGVIPLNASHLVLHVDVQGDSLWYSVVSGTDDFTSHLIERGIWPPQPDHVHRLADLRTTLVKYYRSLGKPLSTMGAIDQGLTDLADMLEAREWKTESGSPMKIERAAADSKWGKSTATVRTWARRRGGIWMTSQGRGITASNSPMGDWPKRPGEQRGDHWIIRRGDEGRELTVDTNHWKTIADDAIRMGVGDRGTFTIYGEPSDHHGTASHYASEYSVATFGRGRGLLEWKVRPEHSDNHWLDNLYNAMALLSVCGCNASGQVAKMAKKKLKLSEIQAQRRAGR